jgi:TonB-linked SusC/RagA family outer membrane protein
METNYAKSSGRGLASKIASFVAFILLGLSAYAQEMEVKGKVSSDAGEPLIGVTVVVAGTATGTVTDIDGGFALRVPGPDAQLTFSYVGFVSKTEAVAGRSFIELGMEEESQAIEAVTVTALGIARASRSVGFSVQEVKGDDMKKVQEVNPISNLVGKIAGMTVSSSAELLEAPKVILRGSSDVLMVIDGVPVNSDGFGISAGDIESYTVLKGPNAAALYGSRGQNGAILITTKKGSKDRVSVDFSTTNFIDAGFLSLPQMQTEYGIGENYNYAFGDKELDGGKFARANVWGPRLEGQPIAQWNSPMNAETGKRDSTPFISYKGNLEKYLETGFMTSNNASVSTSYDRFSSRISLGHVYQKSYLPNAKLNSSNANIYTGYNLTNKLKAEASLNYNRQYSPNVPNTNYGPDCAVYTFGVYGSSHWNIEDMEQYWMPGKEGIQQQFAEYGRANNPYFLANEWLREHYKTDIVGYAKLTYEFSPELMLSLRSQVTSWDMLRNEKSPVSVNSYGRESEKMGDYSEDRRSLFENNTDLLLTWNKFLTENWHVSALGGGNIRNMEFNSSWITTDYLVVPGVYNFSNSRYALRGYSYDAAMSVHSLYSGLDITFKNFVTLSGTGRVDKLSTLPSDNNTFFYPSLTLSTMVSDYVPLPKFVSSVKARASFANVKGGLTQSNIGASFNAMGFSQPYSGRRPLMTPYNGPTYENQDSYQSVSHYNGVPALNLNSTMSDPGLQPYSVTSYEAGTDWGFFNDRAGIDFTYFRMINGPQIFAKDAAPSTGYQKVLINGLVTQKDGVELTGTIIPISKRGGLQWQIVGNWATYKETLREAYGDEDGISLNGHYYEKGERLDAFYGTKYNRTADGQIIYDGTGMPLYSPRGEAHNRFLGYTNPDFVWGVNNTVRYKNVSFAFQFDGRVGGVMFHELAARQFQSGNSPALVEGAYGEARRAEWESFKETGSIEPGYVGKGVKLVSGTPKFEKGEIVNMDELVFEENDDAVRLQSYAQSVYSNSQEEFMVSKTYAKLREVSLAYSFPAAKLGRYIKELNIALVGKNLLYFAAVKDLDMDQYGEGFSAASRQNTFRGERRLQSPTTRQIGFNMSLRF